ncbi:phage tail tape measure protein, lambda family [Loktanella fryxellensis]|uniref:Phage tail tape measure protein, lambda family n=1 Tax=Loktanella fryxellensis TaxID=245187 RepID=A0A1H8J6V4_9RHOB|nr:phage tail tape measure protein [Loktanella fryxellensis]SEN76026.1 phage tail tape measure protein, lambda family [Loktanella fryxellensis]
MAEKRVSVRLVAVGGRQVRAELEGIGDAGSRGFGRLSAEMEQANARLGGFARKAGIALAALTAAAAAAGVAMIRSGLDTIGAQADMAASLKTTVESLQVLTLAGELAGVSLGEIEQATKKLTTRLSEAAAGSGSAVGALERLNLTAAELQAMPLDQRIIAIQDALSRLVPEAERAAVASDLFGDRAALAFLRIDPATLREAARDARDFGVAVSASDAVQIERTGDAIAKLGLIWLGLTNRLTAAVAPALETVANALADMARGTGPIGGAITALFDNLGRLATYATTFAALMAGRWVAGLAVAALSVRGLATALVVLRGALIRTGIGALIVGAGELVFQFGRLVQGAGGFGAALGLLGDLVRDVWERMKLGMVAVGLQIMASWAGIKASIAEALQASLVAVVGFGNATLNTFQGAIDAVKVLWSALPATIGDFAFQAANALIGGVEAMLNGVASRIDGFLEGINAGLDVLGVEKRVPLIGTIDLGGIENPFEGAAANAGAEARAAFEAAFNQNPIAPPDLGLTELAGAARAEAEALRGTMAGVVEAATAPLQSVDALRAALSSGTADATTGLSAAQGAATGLESALDGVGEAADGAGSAGRAAGGALREGADAAKNAWEATAEALRKAQEKSREIAQGLAEDITGPIKEALTSGEFTWQTFAGAISRIAQNLATRLIDLAFKPIENALINAFSGGGGGGGFLASLFGFAKGGVFAGGAELTAFARGGVVNRPTVFPFAKGVGLMGEAGPEAILPLRRGKGGRLGVEMNGDGAAAAASMSTRIINVLDPSVVGDYLATPSGERAILNVIRRNRGAINA